MSTLIMSLSTSDVIVVKCFSFNEYLYWYHQQTVCKNIRYWAQVINNYITEKEIVPAYEFQVNLNTSGWLHSLSQFIIYDFKKLNPNVNNAYLVLLKAKSYHNYKYDVTTVKQITQIYVIMGVFTWNRHLSTPWVWWHWKEAFCVHPMGIMAVNVLKSVAWDLLSGWVN